LLLKLGKLLRDFLQVYQQSQLEWVDITYVLFLEQMLAPDVGVKDGL
jgi:hypothetical protein